ncbi:MAG: HepT-like ribonuclease domain-containing protein [Planctomycetota bacterium]|jgi:uncharacterized protein with HEPN domain
MPNNTDADKIFHIIESGREAIGYVQGKQRRDLDNDKMLVHSLVRCLEIIGEAAARISDEGKTAIPQVPWNSIVGMRNRLIHAYFDINLDTVWHTVKEELPQLLEILEQHTD